MIVGGMWMQAVGILLVLVGTDFPAWALAMGLLGLGTALVYPTLLAAISDVAHPDWRASAVGVYQEGGGGCRPRGGPRRTPRQTPRGVRFGRPRSTHLLYISDFGGLKIPLPVKSPHNRGVAYSPGLVPTFGGGCRKKYPKKEEGVGKEWVRSRDILPFFFTLQKIKVYLGVKRT